jgi:hypothetical protein
MQGSHINIITQNDKVNSFMKNVRIVEKKQKVTFYICFLFMKQIVSGMKKNLTKNFINHFGALQKQFSFHFKDVPCSKYEWLRKSFVANVCRLTTCEQEQLKDIYCEGSLKDMLHADEVPQFWQLVKKTIQVRQKKQ